MSSEVTTNEVQEDQGLEESLKTEAADESPKEAAAPEALPALASETTGYVPEYKYNYGAKDHEIEEFWRPLIKDKATEERVREAMQKLAGFEEYKGYKKKLEEIEPSVNELAELQEMYRSGRHEELLEKAGYTDEMIFNIARAKLERAKYTPEQRADYEEKRKLQLERERLLQDNKKYESQLRAETASWINYQIDAELGKQEYRGLIDKYEAVNGKGSFRDLLIARGEIQSNRAGRTVPPSEVVASIAREYQAFMPSPAETQVAHKQQVKVIPNVKGAGSSPERTKVKSLDDIRKLAHSAAASDED